jgi:hypothetical protein
MDDDTRAGELAKRRTERDMERHGFVQASPITPDEVDRRRHIPSVVFEVMNDEIAKAWNGREARVMQDRVADRVSCRLAVEWYGHSFGDDVERDASKASKARERMFAEHLLDVEKRYEEAGWSVVYDKPGYNETYEAFWVFTRPARR